MNDQIGYFKIYISYEHKKFFIICDKTELNLKYNYINFYENKTQLNINIEKEKKYKHHGTYIILEQKDLNIEIKFFSNYKNPFQTGLKIYPNNNQLCIEPLTSLDKEFIFIINSLNF